MELKEVKIKPEINKKSESIVLEMRSRTPIYQRYEEII